MNQIELDALPEIGGFGYRDEVRDGKPVRIPVLRPTFALFDPVVVTDNRGERWMVGTANGKTWKSKMPRLG